MARLIINADDFGYTAGVNRAIAELAQKGVLTSATLMAGGAASDDAFACIQFSQGVSSLPFGVGCHVVLVDGEPVTAPARVASLLAPLRAGSLRRPVFRGTLGAFVTDLERGRILEADIETEAVAQIRSLQARGLSVTHVDTHKHTHMFARVLRPLLRAALQCGVKAIRNPFEPRWSQAATSGAPLVRRAEVRLLALLRPGFERLVADAGMLTPAGALGVLATGTLDNQSLSTILHAARRGSEATTWELVCHPGYCDADLARQPTRLQASREQERAALLRALPVLREFELVHFGRLEPSGSANVH